MRARRARSWEDMTNKRQPGVLGSLPRRRPHRRSDKRPDAVAPVGAREPEPSTAAPTPKRAPAKPRAAKPRAAAAAKPRTAKPRTAKPRTAKPRPAAAAKPVAKPADAPKPPQAPAREPAPPPVPVPGTLGTAVQAAAELAEIGLQASARALRRTLSRLPRP